MTLLLAARPGFTTEQAGVVSSDPAGAATEGESSGPGAASVTHWTRETEARPEDPRAWAELGDALMQWSREVPAGSVYDRAEAAYRRALALDPRRPGAMVGLAWVANSRHDFDTGRRWAIQALSIESHLPEAHALLGDAAVEAGDYDGAFEEYQACLDQRPDLSAYARSAHLLWLTGDSRRAQALMYRAIQAGGLHPENTAWCRAELGLMMFHQGALLPAQKQLEQALAEAPRHPHVLAAMGRLKAAQQEYPAAIQFYERALAIADQHATLAALTDLYALTGDSEKSERTFQRVLRFHGEPEHSHPHPGASEGSSAAAASHAHGSAELASFLADHDRDLSEALRLAEEAAGISQSVVALDALAWCYYKNGRLDEARETMRKALRWRTPDATLLYHAGMIHTGLPDRALAKRYLYQALNLNPRFDPVHAPVAAKAFESLSHSPAGS